MRPAILACSFLVFSAAVACGSEWHADFHSYGDDNYGPPPLVDASRPDSGHRAAAPQVGAGDAASSDAQDDDAGDASDAAQD